jgi:hypothetical protein
MHGFWCKYLAGLRPFWPSGLMQAVAKLIVPDWEDKVDSGRVVIPPARLHRMGAVTTTYAGVNSISQSAAMNLATGSKFGERLHYAICRKI